ncbi:glycosyltransferase family 61 protein [Stieleria varia]|uniref:Glycosyltransferase 61 catalytic domain-containing protein n=1 Tax=Stieleria varia TaxID=2528005 RepID=A0A5C6B4B4_9BACT|nr:glycosyltransferase family 61 protein [Stieleria varia]TWU06126.1 hypothetical protein Pla52n_18460 [Stieleria varia]
MNRLPCSSPQKRSSAGRPSIGRPSIGHSIDALDAASHYPIRPPKNIQPVDDWMFDNLAGGCALPETSVTTYHQITVPGRGPIRWQGEYLRECFATDDGPAEFYRRRKHWRAFAESLVRPKSRMTNPALCITDNWSCGYFHWICDALPRLLLAEQVRSTAELTLLLPAAAKRYGFIRDSLDAFDLADVRQLSRFQRVHCDELVLPSHAAVTGTFRPDLIDAMRDRFWKHVSAGSTDGTAAPCTRRVFLSRRDANRRRVVNEAELASVLTNHRFDSVAADSYSWREQVELFSSTSHLVSIHGAGLTNMIAMPPAGRVLEIRDRVDLTPNCYVTLATAAGQDYYYAFSDRVNPQQCVHHGDVRIDPAELDRSLDQMLNDPVSEFSYRRMRTSANTPRTENRPTPLHSS